MSNVLKQELPIQCWICWVIFHLGCQVPTKILKCVEYTHMKKVPHKMSTYSSRTIYDYWWRHLEKHEKTIWDVTYRNIKSKKYKSSGWIKLNHQPALQFCPDNSINKPVFRELVTPWFRELVMPWFHFRPWNPAESNLYLYVPRWEKILLLEMVILLSLANPYNGCVNPYYCLVEFYPLIQHTHGSWSTPYIPI